MTVKALTNENDFSYKKDYLNVCGNFKVIESLIEYGDSDPRESVSVMISTYSIQK